MERTFEIAAALVGRAASPLAPVYLDADLELKQRLLDAVSPSSKACDNMDYVPAAYSLALISNQIVARRDIVRHGT